MRIREWEPSSFPGSQAVEAAAGYFAAGYILLSMAGAFILVAIGRSAIKEFRRRTIYAAASASSRKS